MRNKFEQLIEYIINDETEKANELFHNVVVEKSREIYNELVAEDMDDMDEGGMSMDQTDDMMGDISADEEGMGHDDEEGDEMSFGDDDMGADHDEGSMEDRVVDLEDALDDLKAEFERLMSDEAGEEEHSDMPEEGVMREYTEKVGEFYKGDFGGSPRGQNVGANTGDHENTGEKNTKSIVAGKNDMGGTAKNLAQGGDNEDPDGKQYKKPSNAYTKGEGKLKGAGSFENVPGANAGKAFSGAKKPTSSEPAGVNKKNIVAK